MSKYRSYARAVAYLDLVIAALLMLWLVFGMFNVALTIAGFTGFEVKMEFSYLDGIKKISLNGLVTNSFKWILSAASAMCADIALYLWGATRLLSATVMCRKPEPVEELRLACTWMIVSLVIFVIDMFNFVALGLILAAINLLVRGAMMIYIVKPYMEELDMIITSVPNAVIVRK